MQAHTSGNMNNEGNKHKKTLDLTSPRFTLIRVKGIKYTLTETRTNDVLLEQIFKIDTFNKEGKGRKFRTVDVKAYTSLVKQKLSVRKLSDAHTSQNT